jgi:predicted RNA-binding protein YlqC (UPF0109 family)
VRKATKKEMNPKEFVKYLIESIAPEAMLSVSYDPDRLLVVAQLEDSKHQGKVVGKKGITIAALKVLLWYNGLESEDVPVRLSLLEPERKILEPSYPYMPSHNPDYQFVEQFVSTVMTNVGLNQFSMSHGYNDRESPELSIVVPTQYRKMYSEPDLFAALKTITTVVSRFNGGQIDLKINFRNADK